MGRKTYESLPRRPLPGRHNVVLTGTHIEGVECCSDPKKLKLDSRYDYFVMGGASVYEYYLSSGLVEELIISRIPGVHFGDVYFPEIPEFYEIVDVKDFQDFKVEIWNKIKS